MRAYLVSVIVKFLLNQGLSYLSGDIDEIKKDIEQWLIEEIDPIWLERVALTVFDGVWGLIISLVRGELEALGHGHVSFGAQQHLKVRSKLTAKISDELKISV